MNSRRKRVTVDSVLKVIPDILIVLDKNGKYLDVLAHEEDKLYLPKKQVVGKNVKEILPEEVAEKFKSAICLALETKALQTIEYPLNTPAGHLNFEARIVPEADDCVVAFVRDITSKKDTEKIIKKHSLLASEHSQLLSVFDSMEHSIYVADMDNYEILYANKALQDIYKKTLVGSLCYQSLQGSDYPCEFCTNAKIKTNNYQPYHWEYHNPSLNAWFHLIDKVIKWPDGRDVRLEVAIDMTERKMLEERLKIMATTDSLTGLWNRRYFLQAGNLEFERAQRYKTAFSLMLLDIDQFKRVNDSYGHAMGDKALECFSFAIKKTLRETDICGRMGGEEFGFILPHTDAKNALAFAQRLRENISLHPVEEKEYHDLGITASIGLTSYKGGLQSFEHMLRDADFAMYQAKAKGRNCIIQKA